MVFFGGVKKLEIRTCTCHVESTHKYILNKNEIYFFLFVLFVFLFSNL